MRPLGKVVATPARKLFYLFQISARHDGGMISPPPRCEARYSLWRLGTVPSPQERRPVPRRSSHCPTVTTAGQCQKTEGLEMVAGCCSVGKGQKEPRPLYR